MACSFRSSDTFGIVGCRAVVNVLAGDVYDSYMSPAFQFGFRWEVSLLLSVILSAKSLSKESAYFNAKDPFLILNVNITEYTRVRKGVLRD